MTPTVCATLPRHVNFTLPMSVFTTSPVMPATGYQSTVGAVSGLHAATSSTGDVLATRIRSTASAVSQAADRYSQTENQAADALTASIDTDAV